MKVATNIEWDIDSGDEDLVDMLPNNVLFHFPIEDDEIADALSDAYGFCVRSFMIEEE